MILTITIVMMTSFITTTTSPAAATKTNDDGFDSTDNQYLNVTRVTRVHDDEVQGLCEKIMMAMKTSGKFKER